MYEFGPQVERSVYNHVLHDLLTERGRPNASEIVIVCNFVPFRETENHVLMTESARYLTNQLLLGEAQSLHIGDPQSPELARARQLYDNELNGMEDWMLTHLQGFLQHDFHEYNARPYQRLSIDALRNLASYADNRKPDGRVTTAARMVLDYLTAKYAVSNSALRRATPFRRHY